MAGRAQSVHVVGGHITGDRPFTIAVGGSGRREDWEAERDHIRAVAAAGADWWIEWVPPGEREAMVAAVERGSLRPSAEVSPPA